MEGLIYSFFAGISTSIGVILIIIFGKPNEKLLSTLLGFAGGIMVSISVFELMPESVEVGSLISTVIGFLLGAAIMRILDKYVPHSHLSETENIVEESAENFKVEANSMMRAGCLILFGIGIHNLPEGLAIGAGLESSPEFGMDIALAIALHNIPEGLAMAGPLKAGGLESKKIFLFTLIAGLMTPLGTIIGLIFFKISPAFIGGSLAFAAGAMIYIVIDEIVPKANEINSHFSNLGMISGILLGFAFL
ncbi:MAG: ZIP family metal transporter [Tissierellia bacterium]|nr:ZIP family metal transporter [Tissierellia bacterium]